MWAPTLELNSGKTIPAIGFGTYSPVKGQAYDATLHALKAGYHHLDTA
jgi:diketogulonate reductase-like aldo/keto reductase